MSTAKTRFVKPTDKQIAAAKTHLPKIAKKIVETQTGALNLLREVAESDSSTLHWVSTVDAVKALRKVDDELAKLETDLLGMAVVAGAPVSAACREVWISPSAFKRRAADTPAKYILVNEAV